MPAAGKILADVNIWLAALVEVHPHHDRVTGWLREEVVPGGLELSFCRLTQLGLLRLLTNRTVMGEARRTPREAWSDWRRILEQPPMTFQEEPPSVEDRLESLIREQPAARGLWTDAYLAAFAMESGVMLATLDRGFRRFPDLELILL